MATASRSVPARHGWAWIVEGFALFRKSPATWLLVLLALVVVMKVLVFVPVLGIVFVLLMPVFIAGLMDGCLAVERGEALQFGHLLVGFRRNAAQLVTIGGVSLVGNLIDHDDRGQPRRRSDVVDEQDHVPEAGGRSSAREGHAGSGIHCRAGSHRRHDRLRSAADGALVCSPAGVLSERGGAQSDAVEPRRVLEERQLPLLVYGVAIMVGMFLVMPLALALRQYDLALWLLAPVVLPSLYVSYKDVYLRRNGAAAGADSRSQARSARHARWRAPFTPVQVARIRASATSIRESRKFT